MKGKNDVIKEFNEVVNMTADDLEKWLKSDDSQSAGWPRGDDGNADGESVGHDSGKKITEILRSNPKKEESKYTDDQIDHMRKVVAYCKRHLAQEEKSNDKKSDAEVKKTKSYASLKNWGHDPLIKRTASSGNKNSEKKEDEDAEMKDNDEDEDEDDADDDNEEEEEEGEEEYDDDDDEEEEEEEEEDDQPGNKRKKAADDQASPNKARKTRSSTNNKANNGQQQKKQGKKKDKKEDNDNDNDDDEEYQEDDGEDENQGKEEKKSGGGGSEGTSKGPKKGDTVSWAWGNGHPEGKVLDVKDGKTNITTKNGNQVSRDGEPDDPAVVLDTGKSKAIKLDHELD